MGFLLLRQSTLSQAMFLNGARLFVADGSCDWSSSVQDLAYTTVVAIASGNPPISPLKRLV